MQVPNELKPYRRPRLTRSNCAIDVKYQATLYARWALRKGLICVHVYPYNARSPTTVEVRGVLLSVAPELSLVNVKPEDWR